MRTYSYSEQLRQLIEISIIISNAITLRNLPVDSASTRSYCMRICTIRAMEKSRLQFVNTTTNCGFTRRHRHKRWKYLTQACNPTQPTAITERPTKAAPANGNNTKAEPTIKAPEKPIAEVKLTAGREVSNVWCAMARRLKASITVATAKSKMSPNVYLNTSSRKQTRRRSPWIAARRFNAACQSPLRTAASSSERDSSAAGREAISR